MVEGWFCPGQGNCHNEDRDEVSYGGPEKYRRVLGYDNSILVFFDVVVLLDDGDDWFPMAHYWCEGNSVYKTKISHKDGVESRPKEIAKIHSPQDVLNVHLTIY